MNSRPLGDRHRHVGFAGMTLDLDQSLGKILEKLEELGMSDDTYVIYMSDNGGVPNIPGAKKYEQSLNHPLQRGKWDAMEGGFGFRWLSRDLEFCRGLIPTPTFGELTCCQPSPIWRMDWRFCQTAWTGAA